MAKEFIRRIIKNGRGTYYVNVPKKIIAELKWKEKKRVQVRRDGDWLIVEDYPSQRKLFQ